MFAPDWVVTNALKVWTRTQWQGNPAREVAVAEAPKVRMRI